MKIGDKVQVIGHSNWRGEIIEITDIIDTALYPYVCIDSEGMRCIFNKEDLKLIKTNMKKSDLKDGMICKLRDGSKCLFIKDKFYKIINDGFMCISLSHTLNENLINEGGLRESWDIVEVQSLEGESIWQREETTELTMQEIADKFNIEVTDLKIKK